MRPLWCHDCPILEHCPHRQVQASIYLATNEGKLVVDDEKMERMEKLMKLAVENCPLLKVFPLFERMSVGS